MQSPYFVRYQRHPDLTFFRPFGCTMIVHRGRDLVEHSKLAPRGEKCIYLGVGTTHGRRAFIGYSARLNRVYATVEAKFDETHFPMRTTNQRVYGRHHQAHVDIDQLSLYHDMPNPTVAEIVERLNSTNVPHNTHWTLNDLLQLPAHFEASVTGNSGDISPGSSGDAAPIEDIPYAECETAGINNTDDAAGFIPNDKARNTVFIHGSPAPYGTLPPSWKDAGKRVMSKVSNAELAEYLIGTEAQLKLPMEYWPEDKVSWYVQIMDHEPNKKARGGHMYKAVLIRSEPHYDRQPGEPKVYDASLSAWHIRNAIHLHYGKGRTLEEMFLPDPGSMSMFAAGCKRAIGAIRGKLHGASRIARHESASTLEAAMIGMVCTAAACDEFEQQHAGIRPTPRSFYDIKGRPDEKVWMQACDKEIKKLFDMGTFTIIDSSDMPSGSKEIDCCFSSKIKKDSEGNILEYRMRCNADGRQQAPGSYGDTFAPTSKFSCIRTICAIAAQEGLTLYQFDVKGAFLLAECKEDVFIRLPGKYRLPKGKTLKCRRLLYGLKQSASGWNQMFSKWLTEYGFYNIDGDGVTYVKTAKNEQGADSKILLSIHVDDGIAACNDEKMYKQFIASMSKDFDLSDSGELKWFLGCKVEQDKVSGIVRLSQEQYCTDVLKRFQVDDCTPIGTPCEANLHLSASGSPPMNKGDPEIVRNYQQLIGACMYLTTFTRGDCSFAVNQCARFMSNPGPTHMPRIRWDRIYSQPTVG